MTEAATASFDPQPVTLSGNLVILKPLCVDHVQDLFEAGLHENIWRYMPVPMPNTVDKAKNWIDDALKDQQSGVQIPFAICLKNSGQAIGSTRYLDIQVPNRSLEVGWTWISPDYQRTGINTECKFLLFCHAFETLGAVRVQLKTDGRNVQSQNAIARIGAKHEGILRKSRMVWDGVYRDTVYYSILDTEWHLVKSKLISMLEQQY